MTALTQRTGFRARLQRLARGVVTSAIVLGMCGLGAGSPAAAAPDEDGEAVELFLAAGLHGTVAPGAPLSATLTVQNDTEADLSSGRVTVALNRTPLTDGAELSAWLDTGVAEGSFDPLAAELVAPVEPGNAATASAFVSPDLLGAITPGVYPLRAELRGTTTGTGDSLVEREASVASVLVVTAPQAPQVVAAVPITATPEDGSLLTAEELAALTAPDGALTAQLDGLNGTPAVVAVDPAIAASIRALGTAAPSRAVEWLSRLESLPNERFALQFGDADAATQAHAGLAEPLEPTSLTPFLDPKNFQPAQDASSPSPTPSPTQTPEPDLPGNAELTAIQGSLPTILWPRQDVTTEDLAVFDSYLGQSATTILPSTSAAATSGAHAHADGHELLLTDAAASAALSLAAGEPDAVAREQWLTAASAHLFLTAQAAPGAPLLVGLDREESRTAEALRDAVGSVGWTDLGLTGLRTAAPATTTLSAQADAARGAALQTLLTDEASLSDFSTILDDPLLLLGPERIKILRITGVGATPEEFADAFDAHRAETQSTLSAVAVQPSSTIQLYAATADLPVWVRNDLAWPVSVRLSAAPSDLRLEVQSTTDVTALAASNTRIKVPVSARVGSGELDVRLSLTSPSGVPIGQTVAANVSVRAEWETIGLGIFGGVVVLLIVGGVIRTVVRKRRDARTTETSTTDASTTDATTPGAPSAPGRHE